LPCRADSYAAALPTKGVNCECSAQKGSSKSVDATCAKASRLRETGDGHAFTLSQPLPGLRHRDRARTSKEAEPKIVNRAQAHKTATLIAKCMRAPERRDHAR